MPLEVDDELEKYFPVWRSWHSYSLASTPMHGIRMKTNRRMTDVLLLARNACRLARWIPDTTVLTDALKAVRRIGRPSPARRLGLRWAS